MKQTAIKEPTVPDILYVHEHIGCLHYKSDHECLFGYISLTPCQPFLYKKELNTIIFILKGELRVEYEMFNEYKFGADQIIFIPANSVTKMEATTFGCEVISFKFDVPHNVCDTLIFKEYPFPKGDEAFQALPVRERMSIFLTSLRLALGAGVKCEHYHEIKEKEMFYLFKYDYSKSELGILFHSLAEKTTDFKKIIYSNYQNVDNVTELAELANMSETLFRIKFQENFGTSPARWLQIQLANRIAFQAGEPGITVSDLMYKNKFDSLPNFARFCRQNLGCSPSNLILMCQKGEPITVQNMKNSASVENDNKTVEIDK